MSNDIENNTLKKKKKILSKIINPKPLNVDEKKNAKIAYFLCIFGITGIIIQLLYFRIAYGGYSDWWCIVIYWIVFIMPGYLANAMMVLVGGGGPLDKDKNAKDGRRIFGPGKTTRGFLLGPIIGAIIALMIHLTIYSQWNSIVSTVHTLIEQPNVNYTFYNNSAEDLLSDLSLFLIGDRSQDPSLNSFLILLPRVLLCSFGAAFGDLFGSWAKRRKNIGRGQPFWVIDQIDFLGGCLLFAGWFVFLPITQHTIHIIIMTILITPTITIIANNLSYFFGKKSVPW